MLKNTEVFRKMQQTMQSPKNIKTMYYEISLTKSFPFSKKEISQIRKDLNSIIGIKAASVIRANKETAVFGITEEVGGIKESELRNFFLVHKELSCERPKDTNRQFLS